MGYEFWQEFIQPYMDRMFKVIKDEGKYVFIHSCGDIDELFDPLVEISFAFF